jgi:transposase InsO family protein
MPASTVHRVLVRHQLNRLDHLDRVTRAPIRRIEMSHPGELVHVDIKKLGRIPKGGGWRVNGRAHERGRWHRTKVGYAFVHTAIDGYSRLAYSEVLTDEQGATAAAFWQRAEAFFAAHDITVTRVLTDNGSCYRSRDFNTALGNATHTFTQPYRPATNGKVERFNRTLLAEWAYARPWRSDGQRTRALARWLHIYNHHRHHTAIDGPPINRVGNVPGHYS